MKRLVENEIDTIAFNLPLILASAYNSKEVLIKETLVIEEQNPTIHVL